MLKNVERYRDDTCMQAISLIVLPGVIVLVAESYLIVHSYKFSNFKVTKF